MVEQPLNVTLSLPGELTPYETVALYSRVNGFVKTIRVDRGSRVKARRGQSPFSTRPNSARRRPKRSRSCRARRRNSPPFARRPTRTSSTYDKLKAASATPGVVAGNDVVVAQKAVEADQGQIAAAQQNVEAARQALKSVSDMEGYLRITAPFARRRHRAQRASRRAGGSDRRTGRRSAHRAHRRQQPAAARHSRSRGLHGRRDRWHGADIFRSPRIPVRRSPERSRGFRRQWMSAPGRWRWNSR